MISIERLTEMAKALPETELARVISYIEGAVKRPSRVMPCKYSD